MQDRCYKKWLPFNAVINSNTVIKELVKNKNKINKPVLSEDQTNILNEKVLEAYTNHLKIILTIFNNTEMIDLIGYINNINFQNKYITFNSSNIHLNQILNIKTVYY